MAGTKYKIPVIDLFAGPGGLGEGFSACTVGRRRPFQLGLSIEKDPVAHQTLTLRAFYRQFSVGRVPDAYYRCVRGEMTIEELFELKRFKAKADRARQEAQNAELGVMRPATVDRWIRSALEDASEWVLIGGPPCQAYSLVGRSRNRGVRGYRAKDDHRHFLYREYLRIIHRHKPTVFVMENVKGILSAKVDGKPIFPRILRDLSAPPNRRARGYRIHSFVAPSDSTTKNTEPDPRDFVIEGERYGVPQARHRVILLGIRDDLDVLPEHLEESAGVSVRNAISDLPRLRSGLSKRDDAADWRRAVQRSTRQPWFREIKSRSLRTRIKKELGKIAIPRKDRGSGYVQADVSVNGVLGPWCADEKIGGVLNHETRGHIVEDLYRYLFAACFAAEHRRSPRMADFPKSLLPKHKNVDQAVAGRMFGDRFRVQCKNEPATTVTSHISKDGHYYIHYDPTQCRSLTVREAARIQTFPDNYFFCGPRTAQYHQVGNAVPPLLATQLARVVFGVIAKGRESGVTDIMSPEKRSRTMSRIRGRDTKLERIVRSLLHRRGFRFRCHHKGLPGNPDIVLPRYRTAIFMHGCFWHKHDCKYFRMPKSNRDFWKSKLRDNQKRDRRNIQELLLDDWYVAVIWECAIRDQSDASIHTLVERLEAWLRRDRYRRRQVTFAGRRR